MGNSWEDSKVKTQANPKEQWKGDLMELQQVKSKGHFLEIWQVNDLECLSGDGQVNLQGFLQAISQVKVLENWKEPPKDDFLDFFKCTVSCGATRRCLSRWSRWRIGRTICR